MNRGERATGDTWLPRPLRLLRQLEPEAVITSHAYFSHFFNGSFGPDVQPPQIEVLTASEAPALTSRLEQAAPDLRWRR